MKTKYAVTSASLFVVLAAIVGWSTFRTASASRSELVFSHDTHKAVECAKCHPAGTSEKAEDNLVPNGKVCTECHSESDVRNYWGLDASTDLASAVVKPVDRHLTFSHKGHLVFKGMDCATCHGDLSEPGEHLPKMERCSTCHNNGEGENAKDGRLVIAATNRCEACHTTLAGLIPQNHLTVNFGKLHGRQALLGGLEEKCAACHAESFCDECHTPTNDVPLGQSAKRFYLDSWPRGEKQDDGKLLTVQSVHNLTYRYTHGFEARAQSSKCTECHDHETFCSPCHENGYDASGVRILPQSHQIAGFANLTNGGRHKRLAQTDLESCATCHNIDGKDPVCALCHSSGVIQKRN